MIIWLCTGLLPTFGKWTFLLSPNNINNESLSVMSSVIKLYSLGDLHTIYLIKRWMSGPQFINLLRQLVSAKEILDGHTIVSQSHQQEQVAIQMEPKGLVKTGNASSTRKPV